MSTDIFEENDRYLKEEVVLDFLAAKLAGRTQATIMRLILGYDHIAEQVSNIMSGDDAVIKNGAFSQEVKDRLRYTAPD